MYKQLTKAAQLEWVAQTQTALYAAQQACKPLWKIYIEATKPAWDKYLVTRTPAAEQEFNAASKEAMDVYFAATEPLFAPVEQLQREVFEKLYAHLENRANNLTN